jgi:hypothetical protein
MKKLMLWVLCLVFVATAALAADRVDTRGLRFEKPEMLGDLPVSYKDMIATILPAAGRGPLRQSPNVVLEGSEAAFVFPIVGSTPGAGGLFFRSETILFNRRSIAQDIALYYFPTGGGSGNCNLPAKTMRLAAQTWYVFTDFAQDVFNRGGLGAVIVLGITPSGQVDANARIDGNSRIWTPQPGTAGTSSQNFPSMSLFMEPGLQSSFGLRHDEFYRTNWGIFNYDINTRTFDIYVNGARGSRTLSGQNVDGCSLVLSLIPGGPYGSFELGIEARDGRALYFTFGSSVDNATGDSWSVVGRSF